MINEQNLDKLFEIQVELLNNIKNNKEYRDYMIYPYYGQHRYASVGIVDDVVTNVPLPRHAIVLSSPDNPVIRIEPRLDDDGNVNLDLEFFKENREEFSLSDVFKDIETDDIMENTEDFSEYKQIKSQLTEKLDNGCDYTHVSYVDSSRQLSKHYKGYDHFETIQEIGIIDSGKTSIKVSMDDLSTKDFLKEPLKVFNKNSKCNKYDKILNSKKYNTLYNTGNESNLDVKDMLIEEGLIDKNRYEELLEEKAEFDKNEEIARKNIEKIMEDEEFVNSIMDSDDKYISKQVYFVNKNEFSTMDFIDNGFDDTYIKFGDGEKVLVGPNVNNAEEVLAKFTAQAKLYGEFSRNDKYKEYKVNLDSDYGVCLSDETKPYNNSIVIRPDEYSKVTGDFDMRFELSHTKFALLNDYDLLSSIATDNMNDVKRNFIEDVRMRSVVNYDVEGLGRMDHYKWQFFQSIDSGFINIDNDHYEFELKDILEFNKCVHADDIHKLDYLDETIKKFNEHSFVVENVEYLDKNIHNSEQMLTFMVNHQILDEAQYYDKVEEYKEYRFEKIIDSLSNKKQDNTLEM